MMVCAQKDKSRAWDKNSPQMNQENNAKNKKGLMQLFSQMPDSKSPYLTASSLLSQYGRKIIRNKNMHSHPPHTTPNNWIKTNKN